MDVVLGIDLGSTTCKAVLLDRQGSILGRGMTDTRTNYGVAIENATCEAFHAAKLTLLGLMGGFTPREMEWCEVSVRLAATRHRHRALRSRLEDLAVRRAGPAGKSFVEAVSDRVEGILGGEEVWGLLSDRSKFFRDVMVPFYWDAYAAFPSPEELEEDFFAGLLDQALSMVENELLPLDADEVLTSILPPEKRHLGEELKRTSLEVRAQVGTGYGRQLLPFPEERIRSEILCHGRGAFSLFPKTRTVLDIGGQDMKAIQMDETGMVTFFSMNDRCAAGCGRYLGYVAEQLGIGLSELGPTACTACRYTPIASTCTVFAGAELRSLLYAGEKKEEVLLGLHRAIVLRALSLLARSGGVHNELTFTGGVSRNEAVVRILRELIAEHHGDMAINTHGDSIYMGALGAALYALECL